ERSLTERARRTALARCESRANCWLDSDRLLIVSTTLSCVNFDGAPKPWCGSVDIASARTGHVESEPVIHSMLVREGGYPYFLAVSPDGRRLLWSSSTSNDGWPNDAVGTLGGTVVRTWLGACNNTPEWLDSSHCIEADFGGASHIIDIDHPARDRKVSTHGLIPTAASRDRTTHLAVEMGVSQVEVEPVESGLSASEVDRPAVGSLAPNQFRVNVLAGPGRPGDADSRPLRSKLAALPQGWKCCDVTTAPSGDRAIVGGVTDTASPIVQLVRHFLRAEGSPPRRRIGLWITDADGHLTPIGIQDSGADTEISDIHWSPDCRSIAFLYGAAIFVLPVPSR
ncbi:MAG TPA: hypothetical protein VKT77_21620, partial [Chthonomonadaceae bacterium]|nr:hypothetical protein [Chthonomonadaceae bacterium]